MCPRCLLLWLAAGPQKTLLRPQLCVEVSDLVLGGVRRPLQMLISCAPPNLPRNNSMPCSGLQSKQSYTALHAGRVQRAAEWQTLARKHLVRGFAPFRPGRVLGLVVDRNPKFNPAYSP